ncbi:UPF0280 family protein [Candidatus Bathyarchaeota archaeon]|nr:UPF0280 family protein [Candidatus Bathyarchaeota archaeon]
MFTKEYKVKHAHGRIVCDGEKIFQHALSIIQDEMKKINELLCDFPEFKNILEPWSVPINHHGTIPRVVSRMVEAGTLYGVGPMAAVAGAIADEVHDTLNTRGLIGKRFIIENGGELRIHGSQPVILGLQSTTTSIGNKIGFEILPDGNRYAGVGTSSATSGRGLSFGDADLVTVFSTTAAFADAAATAICNEAIGMTGQEIVKKGLEAARRHENITGAFIIGSDHAGTMGVLPRLISFKDEGMDPEVAIGS